MASKVMLNGKLMFPSDYVAAAEFLGRDVSLTIASVSFEDLQIRGGKKERKPVLTFRETKKKLVLNKTNAASIADIHGSKAESWAGKKITLYPTTTRCGRETVDCVRVRETVKASQPHQFEEPIPHEEVTEADGWGDLVTGNEPDPDAPGAPAPVDTALPDSPARSNTSPEPSADGSAGDDSVPPETAARGEDFDPSKATLDELRVAMFQHFPGGVPDDVDAADAHINSTLRLNLTGPWDRLKPINRKTFWALWFSGKWPMAEAARV